MVHPQARRGSEVVRCLPAGRGQFRISCGGGGRKKSTNTGGGTGAMRSPHVPRGAPPRTASASRLARLGRFPRKRVWSGLSFIVHYKNTRCLLRRAPVRVLFCHPVAGMARRLGVLLHCCILDGRCACACRTNSCRSARVADALHAHVNIEVSCWLLPNASNAQKPTTSQGN